MMAVIPPARPRLGALSFTAGRDLKLDPSPASGVQNFFTYPIAEADGTSVKVDKAVKARDL